MSIELSAILNVLVSPALTIGISLTALLISLISLWKTHLSPFNLEISHTSPTFSLYKITPKMSGDKQKRTWWIPSLNIGLSFHNIGQKMGQVINIRIVGEIESNSTKIIFYPIWIVNYATYQKYRTDRFKWLETSVERHWYPLILEGKGTQHLHLVLESSTRLETQITGLMKFRLEVLSSSDKGKWRLCKRYSLPLTKDMYANKHTYMIGS